ncbi:MAG: hypothetical protein NC331_13785 [Lachnospiraceae bacterium]|nr:hypothetical protein [Lachnospiraceae bacterium]MCM1240435.1 hypothetical protein [Lachnospiraceae bacterium]
MSYTVSAAEEREISFRPESTVEEILQNVWFILNTMEHDCPLERGLGMAPGFIDRPIGTAQALSVADVFDKIEAYEPRAEVLEVNFKSSHADGKIYAEVEVNVNGDFNGEEYT